MSAEILRIDRLVKSFRSHWTFRSYPAVKDVSFTVSRGESFGFLGHNGAGKTTTMKCIVGLIRATAGTILFEGERLCSAEQRRSIGYLPELPYFYDHLTVRETLDLFARLHGIDSSERPARIGEVVERVGIADRMSTSVRALSKGLQQRLGFAAAIINRPSLLLLDEPFSGLDPIGRRDMRSLMVELKQEGCTLFLSSHILSDIEEICDRVTIIAKGESRATFHLRDMPDLFGDRYELTVLFPVPDARSAELLAKDAVSFSEQPHPEGTQAHCVYESYASIDRLLPELARAKGRIIRLERTGRRLEEIFVQLTEAPSASNGETPQITVRIDDNGSAENRT